MSNCDRLPPYSPQAEAAVLGCCILDPNTCIPAAVERLGSDPGVFYDLRNAEAFKALVTMFDERIGIDLVTLQQRLKDRGELEHVGGIAYLSALSDAVSSSANLAFHADIVAEQATLRRLIAVATGIANRAYDPQESVGAAVDRAEAEILAIRRNSAKRDFSPIRELTKLAITEIEKLDRARGAITGLPTGLMDLDKMTWGLQRSQMTVVCGFPSTGKTSLAMNIAGHVAIVANQPVGVFSLEMSAVSLAMRMLCSHGRVNLRQLREEGVYDRDYPKLTAAAGRLSNSLLWVNDISGLSVYDLRAKARRLHQEHGIALFVVDYIQLMNAAANGKKDPENRTKEMDSISHGLQGLFKELGCHGLVLSQITDDGKLRDSRAIGQDADGVWRLETEKDQDPSEATIPVKLNILKQRNGPTGPVNLTFLKSYTRFEGVAKVNRDDIPPTDNY
jgi:replicative DNA helicase